ncbi:MAG: DUF6607 family protein [Pseudomonadota bacterium]
MKLRVNRLAPLVMCLALFAGCAAVPAQTEDTTTDGVVEDTETQDDPGNDYIFAWSFIDGSDMEPRGGTSEGPDVTPVTDASAAWSALQEQGLSRQERDRRAILAMAGGYRASFDFLETAGFTADYAPAKPYRSWGTEYVYVVENQPDFVSLQHILVMFFKDENGQVQGPAVVKHWRQDWQYEDAEINVYTGHNRWARKTLSKESVAGTWSQSVYQVDDSPRYQAVGTWIHDQNFSAWQSDETWRPLPRREFSVRKDYHALIGTNRHTILPTGWLHEEDNLKAVLMDGEQAMDAPIRYLARETGVNRYELITDHDFSGGDEYWAKSAEFWSDVRDTWTELLASSAVVSKREVDGMPMLMKMLQYSSEIEEYDSSTGKAYIDEQLASHYNW